MERFKITYPDCLGCSIRKVKTLHHCNPVIRSKWEVFDPKQGPLVPLCRECHRLIHKTYSNEMIRREFNTSKKTLEELNLIYKGKNFVLRFNNSRRIVKHVRGFYNESCDCSRCKVFRYKYKAPSAK